MALEFPAVTADRVLASLSADNNVRSDSDPIKRDVKAYFHIDTTEQMREFLMTQLDKLDFQEELRGLIDDAPIVKEYLDVRRDDWTIISTYCQGNDLVIVVYNNITKQVIEDTTFAQGLRYSPCMADR